MPELVFLLLRVTCLGLLWLFVLLTVRVIRQDVFRPATARPGRRTQRVGAAQAAAALPKAGKAKAAKQLVVVEGPLTGTTITLGAAPVTIGRAPDSTVVLSDTYASTNHARLTPKDGGWVLEDLGSTNGTYLDKTRLSKPVTVRPGAKVRIGETTMELR